MQYKNKKNLYKLIITTILLGLIISLSGCNWFSLGLFNIIDPQAQIRLNYTEINLVDGSISLEIYSLNEVEFIGTGFEYNYFVGTTLISSLYKMVGATFYVAPSNTPGMPGEITTIENLPLYFQEVQDYITLNPQITELTCTLNMIGTDGAGHDITKSLTVDLPAIQPGVDFIPPVAKIITDPSPPSGNIPLTVTFDGSESCDKRNEASECKKSGIASYSWNFGDGNTSTSVVVSHTYDTPGSYPVTLTVTDYFNNQDIATITVAAGDSAGPTAAIKTTPDPPYVIDQNITFDGTASAVSEDCGCGTTIVSYEWDFGDGETDSGPIVTHSYDTADTYTVTLTVTDSNGKSAVTSVTVTVS